MGPRTVRETKKKAIVGIILGIIVLLLFLPFSPRTTSSQLEFTFFAISLGAMICWLVIVLPHIRMGIEPRIRRVISKVSITSVAVVLVVATVFPVAWMITSSIRPYALLFSRTFEFIPANPTLDAYLWVFTESKFFIWLKNSLIVSLLTVGLVLLFVIPGAYAFSRYRFWKKESFLYGYFILMQAVGGFGIAGLIALYAIMANLDLLNSLPVLSIIYAAGAIPYNTWLLKTFLDSVPKDFDEAALMDGASVFGTIRHVILPIAKPGIAVVALFAFMGGWGEFILASTFLNPQNYTLSVGLYTMIGQYETPWNQFAAMSIMFAIPMIIFFIVAQRYLRAGLAMGGIKG